MPNPFHNAIANGLAAIRQTAGVTVVYRRAEHEVELTAVPGRSEHEVDDGYSLVKAHSRDYLIAAADLVLNDEQTLPERGDQIIETGPDGEQLVYEVMWPVRGGEWDWSDAARTQLRIRTKHVATETGGDE